MQGQGNDTFEDRHEYQYGGTANKDKQDVKYAECDPQLRRIKGGVGHDDDTDDEKDHGVGHVGHHLPELVQEV